MTDGFLLVDKDGGWTSHDVVAKSRNLLGVKKVGHAGTLDPMATGLVVLGVGRATRLLRFVQELRKEYIAVAQFGVATESLDADGAILSREPMPVTEEEVTAVLGRFTGDIMQVPPMVSARKVEGKRLYELAREGKEVIRDARQVTIDEIELTDFAPSDYPEVGFRVVCSKGTYVRTLADDIARSLGGRAHLTALRRTRSGSLLVDHAVTIDGLAEAIGRGAPPVIPSAEALRDYPSQVVDDAALSKVGHGVSVAKTARSAGDGDWVRMVSRDGTLLAMYRVAGPQLVPEVVVS